MQEDGRANDIGHLALRCLGDIIAYFVFHHLYMTLLVLDHVALGVFRRVLDTVFVEPVDSVDVGKAEEGARGRLEVWVELLDNHCGGWVGKKDVHGLADLGEAEVNIRYETEEKGADNFLNVGHEVFKFNEGELGL